MGKYNQNDKKSSQSSSITNKIKQTIRERSLSNTRSSSQNSNRARASNIALNDENDSRGERSD